MGKRKFKSAPPYVKILTDEMVRKFPTRADAYNYLETEVFIKSDFVNNITETARVEKVNYLIAYEIITNYLTDVLYELDKAVSSKKGKRISVHSYFYFQVGFMESIRNKKNFLEKYFKQLKIRNYE